MVILDDPILEEFIGTQMRYRKKLGIAPISSEVHRKNKEAEEIRNKEFEVRRAEQRKRKPSDTLELNRTKNQNHTTIRTLPQSSQRAVAITYL